MKSTLNKNILLICLGVILGCSTSTEQKNNKNSPDISRKLDQTWQKIEEAGGDRVSRDLFNFVLKALKNGSHSQEIAKALRYAREMQDRDPSSDTYGNFAWYQKHDQPIDRNAVEFCMATGILAWMHHREQLTDSARILLKEIIEYSKEGIKRHEVNPGYTNIYLKKTWNCIAIGESTHDPDFAERGYDMLDNWIQYTLKNGIREYASPTYYRVDMENVNRIMQFAQNEEQRRKARQIMKLFWVDVAANWFPPANRLAGPHSRDYDFIKGGRRDQQFREFVAGAWKGNQSQPAYLPEADDQNEIWQGAKTLEDILNTTPRLILRRWNEDSLKRAVHYVTDDYSIGSSSASYGFIDKSFVINLGNEKTRAINLVMDGRNDPYGKNKETMPSGHRKSLHLRSFLTSVQHKNEVLFLARPNPGEEYLRRNPPVESLKTYLTLPDSGKFWIGDRPVTITEKTGEWDVPPDIPVFYQLEDVSVAIRPILALDVDETQAKIKLVRDSTGKKYNVMRLTFIHSNDPSEAQKGTLAFWARVEKTPAKLKFLALKKAMRQPVQVDRQGDNISIEVPGEDRNLAIHARNDDYATTSTSGFHEALHNVILSVNGRDYGRELLEAAED